MGGILPLELRRLNLISENPLPIPQGIEVREGSLLDSSNDVHLEKTMATVKKLRGDIAAHACIAAGVIETGFLVSNGNSRKFISVTEPGVKVFRLELQGSYTDE